MASDQSVESSSWDYLPGLLELVEQGLEPTDLATRRFVSPQVRGAGSGFATAQERTKLERLWNWLRGFRRDATLSERVPIWAPLVEVWPAPGGKGEFTYTCAAEQELRAEITVFSAAGISGASKRKLSSAIKLVADGHGLVYETRAYLSVYRYSNATTGEVLHRIDVDCTGEVGEFQSRDLPALDHPFASAAPTEAEVRARGLLISRIERLAAHAGTTEVSVKDETLASWKFELASTIPSVPLPFKLGVTCQNTRSFETRFSLPGGCDYAFCCERGVRPIAPLCVALAAG